MKRNVIYCEQGTPEWFTFRLGRVTASNFAKVLSGRSRSGYKTYLRDLVAEYVTQKPMKGYKSKAMEEGLATEPQARDYYAELNNVSVEQVGFIELGDNIGCSPDGLVGTDGMIQIKCPEAPHHIDYYTTNVFPSEHKAQVQGELWVAERQWSDFISHNVDVKHRPHWSIRVQRDEPYIKDLAKAVENFAEELRTRIAKALIPF